MCVVCVVVVVVVVVLVVVLLLVLLQLSDIYCRCPIGTRRYLLGDAGVVQSRMGGIWIQSRTNHVHSHMGRHDQFPLTRLHQSF